MAIGARGAKTTVKDARRIGGERREGIGFPSGEQESMDVFQFRNQLIDDYAEYIRSFIRIRDPRIGEKVEEEMDGGLLWPDPLIQLNPSFKPGAWMDDLVREGVLHSECSRIFRVGKGADRKAEEGERGRPLLKRERAATAARPARSASPTAASGDEYRWD